MARSNIFRKLIGLFLLGGLLLPIGEPVTNASGQPLAAVQAPVLKWSYGGCYSSWCETGWYSSPATADLDGDGQVEVVASAYSIVALNGATGALEWRVPSGADRSSPEDDSVGRTWPGIVIADVDGDRSWEIVTAHSGGTVSVYSANGYFEAGWPRRPTDRELRGLSVFDLDADGTAEILVTGAVGSATNTWVYEHTGALRSGWPQLSGDSGYAWGVFNDNDSIADFDGDGRAEIVVPSDVHYINAYTDGGAQIPANPIYAGKGWGKVGVWESPQIELRGWGACDGQRAESYRANFADGASLIADLNGDGSYEVAAVGNMYDCDAGYPPSRYYALYLFNPDRSRFAQEGYDWSEPAKDSGAPLVEDYGVIETVLPNPVAADLDGDGEKEILFSSYDGRVHAFWLDKHEHGDWPYEVYQPSDGFYRFASEPVVADLDGDGQAEVIFTTWTGKGSYQTGSLVTVNSQGQLLHSVALPAAKGSPNWNGALPAPTLANLDGDADLEVVVNTAHSGFAAYDLPGTANAHILWGTGRGSSLRSGSFPVGFLTPGLSTPTDSDFLGGDLFPVTLRLHSRLSDLVSAEMSLTLSPNISFLGGLSATSGVVTETGGTITWKGHLSGDAPLTVQFNASASGITGDTQVLWNQLVLTNGFGEREEKPVVWIVNGLENYLPVIER